MSLTLNFTPNPPGGFTWRGPWSIVTAYLPNDVVNRSADSFINILANIGSDPLTDGGVHWQLVAGFASSAANTVVAAPDGVPGIPSPRLLVTADIPNLSATYLNLNASGILTGNLKFSNNLVDVGDGTHQPRTVFAATSILAPLMDASAGFRQGGTATSGHVLRGNGSNFVDATLAASDLSNGVTGSGAVVLADSSILLTKYTVSNVGAANDTDTEIGRFTGGADGTLGALTVTLKTHPSAIGGNRYFAIDAADNDAGRKIKLNPNGGAVVCGGIVDASTGYQQNGGAGSGHVLRGNGTSFVDAALAASDLSNGVTGSGAVVLATGPTISSTANFTGTIDVVQPGGTSIFNLDASQHAGTLVTSGGGLFNPFGNTNNFSGLLFVSDYTNTGQMAAFLLAGAQSALISQSGTTFSNTAGTSSKINVYVNGSLAIEIQNNLAGDITVRVMSLRIRPGQ
jgi:hypothetical protein